MSSPLILRSPPSASMIKVHFAWGYGGQYVFVVPAKQLVIVATSSLSNGRDGRHLRAVHALADRVIDAAPL